MPMECLRCGHVENTRREMCPKCSAQMHFTLLAGLQDVEQDELIDVSEIKPPGLLRRTGQWLFAVVWIHIITYGLFAVCLVAMSSAGIDPIAFRQQNPEVVTTAIWVLSVFGIVIGTLIGCRGVYLGQLVGSAAGLGCALAMLAEQYGLGIRQPWYVWPIFCALGSGAGFWAGLRVAGQLLVREKAKFRPVDSWDRRTQPTVAEINPPASRRWNRLVTGIVTAIVLKPVLSWFVAIFVAPAFRNNPGLVDVALKKTEEPFYLLSLLAGGIAAGSATTSGAAQGLLAGIGICLFDSYFRPMPNASAAASRIVMCLVITTIGGILGQKIFPPTRVYANVGEPSQAVLPPKEEEEELPDLNED